MRLPKERPLVAGDDRPGHAVRRVGDAMLPAQLPDAPANGVRVAAAHRSVGAGRIEPLVQGQQVREAVAQHAKKVVALLVSQRQAAGEHELAAVPPRGRPAHRGFQVRVVIAQTGKDGHNARATENAGPRYLLHGRKALPLCGRRCQAEGPSGAHAHSRNNPTWR